MEAYALDWLNLLVRWTHVIVGIAWIGTSFYYIALDYHLLPPKTAEAIDTGVAGEAFEIHGGGFYRVENTASRRRRCRARCTGSSGRRTAPG